ncbi:MAG: DUF6062 family protein [Saccharofermentanales bacterium]
MKERIYTIPVNDAFNAVCECPLCELENKTTQDLLAYFMGPSMMEPDVRMVTNEKGFCKEHLTSLYNRQENRLALGLMLHTHISDICGDINKKLEKSASAGVPAKLFHSGGDIRQGLLKTAEAIEKRVATCALCDRLDYTMDRYIDVILWQYFEDSDFRERFLRTKGFCMPHAAMLVRGCAKYLSASEAVVFVKAMAGLQNDSMNTLRDEIGWFTLKFDYNNADKPWGNSKDAVPRTIRKLNGRSDLKQ